MVKNLLKFPILILAVIIGLGAMASAVPTVIPANSVKNPDTQHVYVPNNQGTGSPQIKSYGFDSTWSLDNSENLPSGSKSYGLAVNDTGSNLYVSVANGSSSQIRNYSLSDGSITPGSYNTMTGDYWSTSSVPGGMAYGGNNRLFVADQGVGRFLIYNTSTNQYVKDINPMLAGKSNVYSIAVTSTTANTYKIYVARKISAGEIYVYNYNSSGDSVIYMKKLTGISYPTQMKVVDDKLYVAINGTNGEDIKVYDTSDESVIGTVKSGITGAYGWTAFDVSKNGEWLVFKKAYSAYEASKMYKVAVADISGNTTADEMFTINKSDGVALSDNRYRICGTYSPTGALNQKNTHDDPGDDIGNQTPANPTNLAQYKIDGTTVIPNEGMTDEDQIVVEFTVSDPDGDLLIPTVSYQGNDIPGWQAHVFPAVASGSTVQFTIPDSGTFTDAQYDWQVKVTDPYDEESATVAYEGSTSFDFEVNTTPDNDGPIANITIPSDGATVAGPVSLNATIDDSTTGGRNIAAAEYFIDTLGAAGSGIAMSATDGTFDEVNEAVTTSIDTTTLSEGPHTLYVRGQDADSNWGNEDSITINIDNIPDNDAPIVTITNPADGAIVSGSIDLQAGIDDTTTGGSNIAAAEYSIDVLAPAGYGNAMTADDGTFDSVNEAVTASIDTTTLSEGSHTLYVRGQDIDSNWSDGESITVTIQNVPDTEGPVATITSPLSGAVVSGTIPLTGGIDDSTTGGSNIQAAEYHIDTLGTPGTGTAMIATDGTFDSVSENTEASPQIDTTTLSEGSHTIYVLGQDSANNWGTETSVTVTVDNEPEDTTAPAAITDLSAAVGAITDSIDISFTAPGDDDTTGTATNYIVKYSYTGEITSDTAFNAATEYVQTWTPQAAGATENFTMSGLSAGDQIWVSIKAQDEVPNTGDLGNCAATIVKNYVAAPTITKIYPQKGPNDIDNHIVIIGENLYMDMTVDIISWDGTVVTPMTSAFHHYSNTMVAVDVPAGLSVGNYEVAVNCPGGTYDDAAHANTLNDFEVILPGTDTTAPAIVADFAAADGEDAQSTLTWTNPADIDLREVLVLRKEGSYPTDHADGAATTVTGAGSMIPEPGATNSYVDTGLTNGTTYYYAVFSRDTSDNWNDTVTDGSNADTATPGTGGPSGEATPITLIYDSVRGNIFWVAVPYDTTYVTASDIIADINTQNGYATDSGDLITSIGRWDGDANPQVYESYDYLELLSSWSGTDFTLETGEAIYLNIKVTTTFTFEGYNDPSFVFNLPFDALRGNIFWISLPYNGDYTDAASVIADINASEGLDPAAGSLVNSIGRWDGTANPQVYESYDYLELLSSWSGSNFTIAPGEGYYINIADHVDSWTPATY